jgi:L-amino acid N-acyltransferase YncA
MRIRRATPADNPAIWAILEPVFAAGETYAVDRDITAPDALNYWCGGTHQARVAENEGAIVGTYYLCPNQGGGGAHVANAGFVTAEGAARRGVARAMLAHALDCARGAGFRAMQFNFVISTNRRAIDIWLAYDFAVVGRLPKAFNHPTEGYVDALVMYRSL